MVVTVGSYYSSITNPVSRAHTLNLYSKHTPLARQPNPDDCRLATAGTGGDTSRELNMVGVEEGVKEREDCRVRSAVSGAGGPIFPRRAPPIPIPPPCGVIGVPPLPPLPPLSIPPPARGVLTRSRVTSSCGDCIVRGQCGFSVGGSV